jgi:hypothetical protein
MVGYEEAGGDGGDGGDGKPNARGLRDVRKHETALREFCAFRHPVIDRLKTGIAAVPDQRCTDKRC